MRALPRMPDLCRSDLRRWASWFAGGVDFPYDRTKHRGVFERTRLTKYTGWSISAKCERGSMLLLIQTMPDDLIFGLQKCIEKFLWKRKSSWATWSDAREFDFGFLNIWTKFSNMYVCIWNYTYLYMWRKSDSRRFEFVNYRDWRHERMHIRLLKQSRLKLSWRAK